LVWGSTNMPRLTALGARASARFSARIDEDVGNFIRGQVGAS
jgi:hypothetical protein